MNFIYKKYIKRILDIIGSICGIVIFLIPVLVLSILIMIEDPGSPYFKQERTGMKKNGKMTHFNMYKLRSMKLTAPHEVPTNMLENPDLHILKIGKFIRKYSIDEIPQLHNVLKGDMSIIGPRPHICSQEDIIIEREKYGANDVKPGLTGWAQINGRDKLSIKEKAKLDGEYANNVSFLFDCRCFFGSFLKVFRADDVVEGKIG